MSRRKRIALWLGIGVVGVAVFLVILGTVVGNPDDGEAEAQGIASSPAQAPTASPTPTLVPAPIVQECPTPEEEVYFQSVGTVSFALMESMAEWGSSLDEIVANPMLFESHAWRMNTIEGLQVLKIHANNLMDIGGPESVTYIDRHLESVARTANLAIDTLDLGIRSMNVDTIDSVAYTISHMNLLAGEVTGMIETFCE